MSTSISSIHRYALGLLQDKKYGEAIIEFSRCMNEIRTAFETMSSKSDGNISDTSISRSITSICQDDLIMIEHDDSIVSPHNIFGFFGAAFPLPVCADHHNLALASHIVLFNLALAYHSAGLYNGRTSFLRKAMEKYQLSLRLLSKQSKEVRQAFFLLELASVTNLGHLHVHFYDVEKARLCRDVICDMLSTVSFKSIVTQQPSLLLLCSDIPMQHWGPAA